MLPPPEHRLARVCHSRDTLAHGADDPVRDLAAETTVSWFSPVRRLLRRVPDYSRRGLPATVDGTDRGRSPTWRRPRCAPPAPSSWHEACEGGLTLWR